AAAVHLDLHAGVRHRVPVDGQARAADVGGPGDPYAPARSQPAALGRVAALRDDLFQAFLQADGAHLHLVGGDGARGQGVVDAPARVVQAQVVAEAVDVA